MMVANWAFSAVDKTAVLMVASMVACLAYPVAVQRVEMMA